MPSKRVLTVGGLVMTVVGLAGAAVWLRPATWDPAVEPYVAFVEESRGLEFDHPVKVRWLSVEDSVGERRGG